jgi:catechol 2,3-dioxygenase-like lactoylglutathione lyase family enzyme
MKLIDGIGGTFLFSNQPKVLASWYQENLGIDPTGEDPTTGAVFKIFEYRDLNDQTVKKSTTWAIIPAKEPLQGTPRTGQVNYRVSDLDKTIAHLKTRGITPEETGDFDYGRFAWVRDPDGNRIELYQEPVKTV